MIAALLALALSGQVGTQAPAAQPPVPAEKPAHVIALYADLDNDTASRAVIVIRAFVEQHPGLASIEIHLNPPDGQPRPVDRALVVARSLSAGLPMAELMLINRDRRSEADFRAMARQLRLDDVQYKAAQAAADPDRAIADDVAAAAALKLPKGMALVIDGQLLTTPLTLTELETRLAPQK